MLDLFECLVLIYIKVVLLGLNILRKTQSVCIISPGEIRIPINNELYEIRNKENPTARPPRTRAP